MLTTFLIVAAAGALVGAFVGYKVGRAAERLSPARKRGDRTDRTDGRPHR